jgi:addiction module HigA family antidote
MIMHKPPHPGDFIKETYLDPFDLSVRYLAMHLKVSPSTINRLIKKESAVSPIMAKKLSIVLGRSPESWLAMQALYDLSTVKSVKLKKIDFDQLDHAG